MMRRLLMAAMVLGAMATTRAEAGLIASNRAGTFVTQASGYAGQSFTTAAGPLVTNITFNFFSDVPATTPYAIGTGFLLAQAYTGTPDDLNTSTAGYLGMAVASNGFYNFGSSVTLANRTQYFFYETSLIPASTITGGSLNPGGNAFFTRSSSDSYLMDNRSDNFAVNGTAVVPTAAVPEPASALMLGLGVAGAGAAGWKRRLPA